MTAERIQKILARAGIAARLDRLWTEAHAAADADALDPAVLALHTPEELARLVLTPHPATRWAWCRRWQE